MTFTDVQKKQIYENLNKITSYIGANILPHITYCYETGKIGGTSDCYIGLNGPYAEKIRFYCCSKWYTAADLAENNTEMAVVFLKYWQDAKSYMNNEIKRNAELVKLIENFEI